MKVITHTFIEYKILQAWNPTRIILNAIVLELYTFTTLNLFFKSQQTLYIYIYLGNCSIEGKCSSLSGRDVVYSWSSRFFQCLSILFLLNNGLERPQRPLSSRLEVGHSKEKEEEKKKNIYSSLTVIQVSSIEVIIFSFFFFHLPHFFSYLEMSRSRENIICGKIFQIEYFNNNVIRKKKKKNKLIL